MIDEQFMHLGAAFVGAGLFAIPRYLSAESTGVRPIVTVATALSMGVAASPIIAPVVGKMIAFLWTPTHEPAYFAVGLLINPLAPAFIKKAEEIIANLPGSFPWSKKP